MLAPVGRLAVIVAALCLLAAAPASLAESSAVLPGIKSPSGNIKCLYNPGPPVFLWCSIGTASYAKKLTAFCARPSVGVDWAGFTLGRKSKGSVACTGGTMYDPSTQHPRYVTLAYGQTWRHGPFTCASKTTGITCRNPAGHGLFVSRESYRLF
jgi:hypothetical protein